MNNKEAIRDYIFWALVGFVMFMCVIISMSVFNAMGIEIQKNLRIFVHGPIAAVATALICFPLYKWFYRSNSDKETGNETNNEEDELNRD